MKVAKLTSHLSLVRSQPSCCLRMTPNYMNTNRGVIQLLTCDPSVLAVRCCGFLCDIPSFLHACCPCLLMCCCVFLWVLPLFELSYMCLFNLQMCTLLLLVLDFYGINCYRNSYKSSCTCFSLGNFSFLLCLEFENDAKGVDKDGGIVGRLQVKLMVPFLLFFFFFKTEKLFFCIFFQTGKKIMMLGV